MGDLIPPEHGEAAILTVEKMRQLLSDPTDDPDPETSQELLKLPEEKQLELLKNMNAESYCPWRSPCILLDSGEYVWDFECWWGLEADVRRVISGEEAQGRVVLPADIREKRIEAGQPADRSPYEADPFRPTLKEESETESEEPEERSIDAD